MQNQGNTLRAKCPTTDLGSSVGSLNHRCQGALLTLCFQVAPRQVVPEADSYGG